MDFIKELNWKTAANNIGFFMTDILGYEMRDFHKEWMDKLTTEHRTCTICAREHGKSIAVSLVYPLWVNVFNPVINPADIYDNNDVFLISNSLKQSQELIKRIQTIIDTNDYFSTLNFKNSTQNKIELREKGNNNRIQSFAFGSAIRGHHPRVAIIDDPLSEQGTYSDLMIHDIFFSAITPLIKHDGYIHVVGTPFAYNDLYSDIKNSNKYKVNTYPAIKEDGTALWPEHWSLEQLSERRQEMGDWLFTREYLCNPIDESTSIFPSDLVRGCIDTRKVFGGDIDPKARYVMGCLTADSEVLTDSGYISISDVTNERVMTHTGEFKDIIHKSEREYTGEVYEIIPRYGYKPITLTPEHPVLINERRKCHKRQSCCHYRCANKTDKCMELKEVFIEAKDLRETDYLIFPLPEYKQIENNPLFYKLVGQFIGDGYVINKSAISICFGFHEETLMNEYIAIFESLYNRKASIYKKKNAYEVYMNVDDSSYFKQFKTRAHNLKLTKDIFSLDNESIKQLLIGYIEADGCIKEYIYDYRSITIATFVSSSLEILEQIQLLLLRFKIPFFINKIRNKGTYNINGRTGPQKELYELKGNTYNSKKLIELFYGKESDYITWRYSGVEVSDKIYIPVKSITKRDYSGLVYNFEIKDNHTYCGHLITVHNCDFAIGTKSSSDYSVATVLKDDFKGNLEIVDIWRKQKVDYEEQVDAIIALYERYNPTRILVEDNVFQAVFKQILAKKFLPVKGYTTTAKKKEQDIFKLHSLMENRVLTLPKGNPWTRDLIERLELELLAFGYKNGKLQGRIGHDDMVMSLAIAVHAATEFPSPIRDGSQYHYDSGDKVLDISGGLDVGFKAPWKSTFISNMGVR